MSVNEVLKDLSKNIKVFKEIKIDDLEANLDSFKEMYWMVSEANLKRNGLPSLDEENKKVVNDFLDTSYRAGYLEALK